MKFEEFRLALKEDDEELMRSCLMNNVIIPCVNRESGTDIEYYIDDVIVAPIGFIKPNLLTVYSFSVAPIGELSYEVYVSARYIDTLSGITSGDFVKSSVVITAQGSVSVNASAFDAIVYVNAMEVV